MDLGSDLTVFIRRGTPIYVADLEKRPRAYTGESIPSRGIDFRWLGRLYSARSAFVAWFFTVRCVAEGTWLLCLKFKVK